MMKGNSDRFGSFSTGIVICRDGPLRVDGIAQLVIQAAKPEPRIMRYELNDHEWAVLSTARG